MQIKSEKCSGGILADRNFWTIECVFKFRKKPIALLMHIF